MSHLGDVAAVSRKAIIFGSLGIVSLMVMRTLWGAGVSWWKANHPDPPPPPDVKFGRLPKIIFPKVEEQPQYTYRLETRTGQLPALDNQFKIFFMPVRNPSLLALDKAKEMANRIGFIQEPIKQSPTVYVWSSSEPVPSSLTMEVIVGSFVMDRKWQDEPQYLTPTMFLSEERATDLSANYLSRLALYYNDLKAGKTRIDYLQAENGQLVPALSLSTSQFLRVHFFRSAIDEVPVVTSKPTVANVSLIMALQREEKKQVVRVDYAYSPVELERFATYPLVGVQTAWTRLQNNQGYVASPAQDTSNVVVRQVYLAYYDAEQAQNFLQPVYVFEGDNGFVGYVPAVADEWTQ